jgi:hypothetical protein
MSDIEAVDPRVKMVRAMPLDSLTVARQDVLTRKFDAVQMLEAIDTEIVRRATEKNATVLFTDECEIEISYTEKIDYRIAKLRTLQGKVPDELFDKAVYLEAQEPIWKTSPIVLKQLAKKYGSEIAEIVEAGMPRVRTGTPKVKITARNIAKVVEEIAA